MINFAPAVQLVDHDDKISKDYSYVGLHMIYDVKMDLTQKARLVADDHKTPDPVLSTYAGVVLCESVRIAFTYAALNDLNVL